MTSRRADRQLSTVTKTETTAAKFGGKLPTFPQPGNVTEPREESGVGRVDGGQSRLEVENTQDGQRMAVMIGWRCMCMRVCVWGGGGGGGACELCWPANFIPLIESLLFLVLFSFLFVCFLLEKAVYSEYMPMLTFRIF